MLTPHAQRVAQANARLAAEGRCIMHNSYENVPARYLMELPIGNVIPLWRRVLRMVASGRPAVGRSNNAARSDHRPAGRPPDG